VSQHIYIYSPSSSVRDRAAFRRGVRRLEKLGYSVELDPAALTHYQRFAGTNEERLNAIGRAAASGADAVLIARGGYGLTRLLPRLPYKAIRQSVENGTRWVGLSDFTAFQLAVMAHAPGTVTWAGPAVGEDFGADPRTATAEQPLPDDIMEDCFADLMQGIGEGAGWRLPTADKKALYKQTESNFSEANYSINTGDKANFLIENSVLWGGNLTMLLSMLGTPFFPKVENGILFLEEVGEHPYRIERMLTQLLHAGVLSRQRAVLLGQFTGYRSIKGYDRGFGMATVVQFLREQLPNVPVFTGLPFGHVPTKVVLPVGLPVDLACDGRDVLLHWHADTQAHGH
jgi:muramoyltetrapeptide carboxypeptidase